MVAPSKAIASNALWHEVALPEVRTEMEEYSASSVELKDTWPVIVPAKD